MDATKKLDFFYLSRFYPLCLYATVAMKLLVKDVCAKHLADYGTASLLPEILTSLSKLPRHKNE